VKVTKYGGGAVDVPPEAQNESSNAFYSNSTSIQKKILPPAKNRRGVGGRGRKGGATKHRSSGLAITDSLVKNCQGGTLGLKVRVRPGKRGSCFFFKRGAAACFYLTSLPACVAPVLCSLHNTTRSMTRYYILRSSPSGKLSKAKHPN